MPNLPSQNSGLTSALWNMVAVATDYPYFVKAKVLSASSYFLPQGSAQRRLAEQGMGFVVGELTDDAFKSTDGIAFVDTPLKDWTQTKQYLGLNKTKAIAVVTDPELIKGVAAYGDFDKKTFDPETRLGFDYLIRMVNRATLLNHNDKSVRQDRNNIRKILADNERILPHVEQEFLQWLKKVEGRKINLTTSIKKLIFKMVNRTVGFKTLPKGKDLQDLIDLVDDVDELLNTNPDNPKSRALYRKTQEYTKWLLENNQVHNGSNLISALIPPTEMKGLNAAMLLAVTSNITRLLVLTFIFLAYHPEWQEKVQKAIQTGDEKFLDRFYKECCRLFITTPMTAKYFSKDHEIESGKSGQKITIPAGTMVVIPHRRIHFECYSNPEVFNPDRPEFLPTSSDDKAVEINTPMLSPFGLGLRQCPASTLYTRKVFDQLLQLSVKHCVMEKPNSTSQTFVLPDSRSTYTKIDTDYPVVVNKVGNKLESTFNKEDILPIVGGLHKLHISKSSDMEQSTLPLPTNHQEEDSRKTSRLSTKSS